MPTFEINLANMLRLFLTILFFSINFYGFNQIRYTEAEITFQSLHIWRGVKLGTAPAIEPSVTFSANRFSFNVWASATTNNSYSEIDLIPAYQFNKFQLTLLDYYNPVLGETNQFLNFRQAYNRHSAELAIDNHSVEKQRLKWMIATFLLGDKNEVTGNPNYSTYIEIKYPFSCLGIETEPFVGLTPFRGYYADQFALVNTGISFSKKLELKLPFTIPLCLTFISNPNTKQSFVTFAFGIAF